VYFEFANGESGKGREVVLVGANTHLNVEKQRVAGAFRRILSMFMRLSNSIVVRLTVRGDGFVVTRIQKL
jgi:hypothetical protein